MAKSKATPKSAVAKRSATAVGLPKRASTVATNLRPPTDGSAWRPSKHQLLAARSKKVPDLIAPELAVLFCGINPGLHSAAVGHHFAGPGNLFWPTLLASGFTPRLLSAFEESELLPLGYGITNLVARTTATADELTHDELHAGARALTRKAQKFRPRFIAVVGLQAYRIAFERRKAVVGLQPETIGSSALWLLPNPSGLNAYHQPALLNEMFRAFHAALDQR